MTSSYDVRPILVNLMQKGGNNGVGIDSGECHV